MKKLIVIALFIGCFAISFTSCRDQRTQEEELVEEMQDKGADIKVKEDKIKMETEHEKVKIKTDDDGDTKIKQKEKE